MQNRSLLEIKKNDRNYQLILDPNSPLGECYDVICELQNYIIQLMNKVSEDMKKAQKEEESED